MTRLPTTETIHEAGARRHPDSWFGANMRAVHVLLGSGLHAEDKEIQRTIALVVLRVLDFVAPYKKAEKKVTNGK